MDYQQLAPPTLHQLSSYARLGRDEAAAAKLFQNFLRRRPDCFSRRCTEGHITASAWVLNPARTHALMTHHRGLDRWFQLGGHLEDHDADLLAAALREVREESGLEEVRALSPAIFDLDRHLIPERDTEPAHFHYDVRYLFEADLVAPQVSSESHAVEWVALGRIASLNDSESVLRMVRRGRACLPPG